MEGRDGGGSFFLLAACAADEEQRKAQQEEYAEAAAEAEAQIAQQDHARCLSYGKPGCASCHQARNGPVSRACAGGALTRWNSGALARGHWL